MSIEQIFFKWKVRLTIRANRNDKKSKWKNFSIEFFFCIQDKIHDNVMPNANEHTTIDFRRCSKSIAKCRRAKPLTFPRRCCRCYRSCCSRRLLSPSSSSLLSSLSSSLSSCRRRLGRLRRLRRRCVVIVVVVVVVVSDAIERNRLCSQLSLAIFKRNCTRPF